jgi:hypothetical protein
MNPLNDDIVPEIESANVEDKLESKFPEKDVVNELLPVGNSEAFEEKATLSCKRRDRYQELLPLTKRATAKTRKRNAAATKPNRRKSSMPKFDCLACERKAECRLREHKRNE